MSHEEMIKVLQEVSAAAREIRREVESLRRHNVEKIRDASVPSPIPGLVGEVENAEIVIPRASLPGYAIGDTLLVSINDCPMRTECVEMTDEDLIFESVDRL